MAIYTKNTCFASIDSCVRFSAYVILEDGLTVADVRSTLAKHLPGYMMPSYFIRLDEMPLTSNGKINYKKLQEMASLLDTGGEQVTLMTRMEAEVVRIWQEVLGLEGYRGS